MPKFAIIAEFKCPQCSKRFKACACASSDWLITCPCGHAFAATEPRAEAPMATLNRVFTGTETLSRAFGFHPDEVGEVREMLGTVGNCIDANGDVNFSNRSEEKAFRDRYKAVRASNEGRVREIEQRQAEYGDDE